MEDYGETDKEILDNASKMLRIFQIMFVVIVFGLIALFSYFDPTSKRIRKEIMEGISKEYGAMIEDIFKVGKIDYIRIAVKDSLFYLDYYYDDRLFCIAEIGDSIYKLKNQNMCVVVCYKTKKKYLVPYLDYPKVTDSYVFKFDEKFRAKYPGIEFITISKKEALNIFRNRKIKKLYSLPSL